MDGLSLLTVPIEETGLSVAFCEKTRNMGFNNLSEILQLRPKHLIEAPGFTYTWLGELVSFLDKKGCLHLLQQ